MSVAAASAATSSAQNPLTVPRPRRLYSLPMTRNRLKSPLFSNSPHAPRLVSFRTKPAASGMEFRRWIGVFSSGEGVDGSPQREVPGEVSLDAVLAVAEFLFIAPPAICFFGCVVGSLLPGACKSFQVNIGSKFFVWQIFLLVGAVAIGGLIRRRQWRRICRETEKTENGVGVDLIKRIEKVEEDLRSSATIIRVISRQLEKLGIRFRVTRKALKEPINETAALAQKNSEATRALAIQEDILEKELGEIQKVLLAMQEQQQKQLELILAIGKAGKIFESKRDAAAPEQGTTVSSNAVPREKQGKQLDIQTGRHRGGNNDRA